MPGSAQDKNATLNGIKALYDAIQPYLNGGTHAGFTPVGSIIAIMGNEAPTHYLKCDGTVYNIVDYPDLAAYFEQQFEAKNFFGGDGVDTFAVPDLQGEFLRGAGTNSHENQGSGEDVGVHQDGSIHSNIYMIENGTGGWAAQRNQSNADNPDKVVGGILQSITGAKTIATNLTATYTSRPTNTSVLYCIATKNIFVDVTDFGEAVDAEDIAAMIAEEPPVARNNFQDYSLNEQIIGRWIDGKPLYQKTYFFASPTDTYELESNIEYAQVIAKSYKRNSTDIDGDDFYYMSSAVTYVFIRSYIQGTTNKMILSISKSANVTLNDLYITIQYTKTTDTV